MKKIFKKSTICILAPEYFKAVMETANNFSKLPYNTNHAKKAWYWKYLFRKMNGYILTGFKMDWQKDKTVPKNLPSGISELADMVDVFHRAPVRMIFVPKELYCKMLNMKSNSFLVEVEEYGTVTTIHEEYGKIPVYCEIASSIIKELTDTELRKIKSVEAFIVGEK